MSTQSKSRQSVGLIILVIMLITVGCGGGLLLKYAPMLFVGLVCLVLGLVAGFLIGILGIAIQEKNNPDWISKLDIFK